MADRVKRCTTTMEFLSLADNPARVALMAAGRGKPGWRALVTEVPVDDPSLVEYAAGLQHGDRVEVTIATDWGAPGLPKRLEALRRAESLVAEPHEEPTVP